MIGLEWTRQLPEAKWRLGYEIQRRLLMERDFQDIWDYDRDVRQFIIDVVSARTDSEAANVVVSRILMQHEKEQRLQRAISKLNEKVATLEKQLNDLTPLQFVPANGGGGGGRGAVTPVTSRLDNHKGAIDDREKRIAALERTAALQSRIAGV